MDRIGAPFRGDVAHAAQRFAHRGLSDGFGLHPRRSRDFAQGVAAVGKAVLHDLGFQRRLSGGQFRHGDRLTAARQQGVDLVVARIAQYGDVVVVADAVAAARPFDQLEQHAVGDRGHGVGLGHQPSAEADLLGHRPRAVDDEDEGRAVGACDALCVHIRIISVRGPCSSLRAGRRRCRSRGRSSRPCRASSRGRGRRRWCGASPRGRCGLR